ncbi:unnamed protein product, partial [Aphanomyces euteiches]
ISVALTNAHIQDHPLRDDDCDFYHRRFNRLVSIGEEIARNRRLSQAKYRSKRRIRLGVGINELPGA